MTGGSRPLGTKRPGAAEVILQKSRRQSLAYYTKQVVCWSVPVVGRDGVARSGDTGIGIDATHLPRIFDGSTRSVIRRVTGARDGAGRAIVRRLADFCIRWRCHRDRQGTRFRLQLPRVAMAKPAGKIARLPAAGPTGKVALIFDDVPDVRDSMVAAIAVSAAAASSSPVARQQPRPAGGPDASLILR